MGNEALIEKATRAFYEAACALAKRTALGDCEEMPPFETMPQAHRDELAECVQAALEASNITALEAERDALREDKARLDWLENESDDLRCFSIPTGAGDADIGWRVVGHFMAKPTERVLGEVQHDSVRDAIDQARASNRRDGQ